MVTIDVKKKNFFKPNDENTKTYTGARSGRCVFNGLHAVTDVDGFA